MERNEKFYQDIVKILEEELVPAMGCTEPIAIAYGASRCRDLLGAVPEKIRIQASGSIIKNVKSVVVPNTGYMKGIEAAAAAGVVAGVTDRMLEVISEVSEEQRSGIARYLDEHEVKVEFLDQGNVFDILITETCGEHTAKLRIVNHHTNIVMEEKDGTVLKEVPFEADEETALTDRSFLTVERIWDFTETCDVADVKELLDRQIAFNMAIAEEGMKNSWGANIGSIVLEMEDDKVNHKAVAMAAAGSDARMNGCELPVIINSGSGNQGITCSVPVIVYARALGAPEEKMYRALVLSNLITIYQKTGIGRLSAFCGAVCAGVASGAGICYLKGGTLREVDHTLVNGLSIVSGIVCDGAKASCAAKIAFSVNAGLMGYEMYHHGQQFRKGDGIVGPSVDETISNVGRLGKEGMKETNKEILQIMVGE